MKKPIRVQRLGCLHGAQAGELEMEESESSFRNVLALVLMVLGFLLGLQVRAFGAS